MEPTVAKLRNAMRQKRRSRRMASKPAPPALLLRHTWPTGALLVPRTMARPATATTPAPQAKAVRQPTSPATQASGVPADRAPLEPMPTRRLETVANRLLGNQDAKAFIAPISTPANPTP